MRDKNKSDGIGKISFDKLNDFISEMYIDFVHEKEKIESNYNRNLKCIDVVKSNIENLENELSCDQNIFKPSYSIVENDEKLNKLKVELEVLLKENEELNSRLLYIENTIKKINHLQINENENIDYFNDYNNTSKIEILRSQEFERKRIARDIHDTVIQKLTNMIHKSEFTLKIMDIDNIRAKLELMTISNSIREIIDEMRNIIYNLRPMAFDDIGIDVIIERELVNIKENGIKVSYDVIGDSTNVDQIVQITLVRIIQEACNNALKHSEFTEFYVKIEYSKDNIEVYIKDNGKGFEIPKDNHIKYESKSGFGLSMMRERVYLLSGLIKFESNKDKGTMIYVKVPKCFREERKDANKHSSC
ncbi:sensor histidine kinase [Candidatus Galacturonibacter soehngenii]|uniref:Oxygen sensor histidine kinase NreB n=1 Tax=Candidatus Galacturonatibacter soehngenii TaxID=2307010 RepID=A0A7V7QIG2_9FIRM|nr:sensor histidine kinase [Candidatus Galacturonibacter soehngenii]KAB1435676.1 sensor histidine kinase [Candidatus Galacturonibacter soehngenii]